MGNCEEQLPITDCRPTVGRQTANSRLTNDRQSADRRPTVGNIKLRAIFLGAIFQVSHHQRTIKKPVHENASSIQRESRVRPSPELMWIKLKISSLNELESCATCKRSLSYNNNGGPKFG